MSTGIITITQRHDNTYELTVSVPASWCERFSPRDGIRIWGDLCGPLWGVAHIDDDKDDAYRVQSATFRTIERCEEVAQNTIHEVEIAKAHLAARKQHQIILDLTPGNRTIQRVDVRNGDHNCPF